MYCFISDVNERGYTYLYCHIIKLQVNKVFAIIVNEQEYFSKVMLVQMISHLVFILLQYQSQI